MAAFPATGGHAPARRRKMGRPAGWTSDKKRTFLAMLISCLNVRRSVDAVGLSYSSAYQLRRRDPDFAQDWAEALDEAYMNLELELLRQAIGGSVRRETLREGENGPIKSVKEIHDHPHGMALRLMQLHREEVLTFRRTDADQQEEERVVAQVDAQMDMVRLRLIGPPEQGTAPILIGNQGEGHQQRQIGSDDEQDRSD